MLELVNHISNSDAGKSLYPWTSMFVLRITQTNHNPIEDSSPHLQISPSSDGSAEFRYIDTYIESRQWVRIAEKGLLIARFDSFIEQVNWKA